MSSITIYLEGGGTGKNTKSALRQGMDTFLSPLKKLAREKSWHWKLVPCGGRQQTFEKFRNAVTGNQPVGVVVLLVDAEAAVGHDTPRTHLESRDSWNLSFVTDDMVHLMVQTMETWIVADPSTLAEYYGQRFIAKALSGATNLETVHKTTILDALKRAIQHTQKGVYQKIRHASDLLKRIDHQQVGRRCPACARLFRTLEQAISAA